MNEAQEDRFILFIQRVVANWHEQIKLLGSVEEGEYLARYILEEYQVVKRGFRAPYFLTLNEDCMPYCEGCENAFGWCGTPCTVCPKADKFFENYESFMHFQNFSVWKRKLDIP